MTMTADRLRLLHGSTAPVAEMRALHAGPVTVLLDGVDLRYLRIGGIELVRRGRSPARAGTRTGMVYHAGRDIEPSVRPAVAAPSHAGVLGRPTLRVTPYRCG